MERLAALQLFVRIVDRRSFSAAAADLKISRPVATAAIKTLEARLGTRLLHRSTRHVAPTAEGEIYYRRYMAILDDIEDADRGADGAVSGLLRVDVAGNLARMFILPQLPAFLARHPALTIQIGERERYVDLVREGVDCVVRAGEPVDSDLIVRRVGMLEEITCASPAYLAQHGEPISPDALDGHVMVGFVSSRTGQVMPLAFTDDGRTIEKLLPTRLLVSGADTRVTAALLGFGLVQAPRHRFADDLVSGALVEILAAYRPPTIPISLLYASNRHLSPRVRLFVDWVTDVLRPHMDGS